MNRRIGIALVVVIVVLAYPLAAWLIGLNAEHIWQQREQQVAQRYPFFETIKREYHRGVYSSTEEVTYRFGGRLAKSMPALAGATAQSSDLQITVRNTLHHGPLPQLRSFAPATIDTEIILPPQLRQKLTEFLGDKATLSIRTRLHWFGGTTTTLSSPAFERKTPEGVAINWRGLDGETDVGSNLQYAKATFTAPGLEVKAARGNVSLENFRGTTDLASSAFESVYLGTIGLTLARLELEQTASGEKTSLRSLTLTSKSSAQGEYLDFDLGLNVEALQVKQFNLTHVGYEIRASHLHGPSVATMNKSMQAMQAQSTTTPDPGRMLEIFKTDGVEILLHDPVLELPRIGFAMPEGELLISIKASAHGFTRAEIEGPPEDLKGVIAKHVQAAADLRIDTALLDKLLDTSGNGDKLTAQLQLLQRQGYLKLDGKALTTHLAFAGGQIQVNGRPFPPVSAGTGQAPPSSHP
ncbi:MAG TPA: YdgA family protein [Steroidobacteraceae bacterium]